MPIAAMMKLSPTLALASCIAFVPTQMSEGSAPCSCLSYFIMSYFVCFVSLVCLHLQQAMLYKGFMTLEAQRQSMCEASAKRFEISYLSSWLRSCMTQTSNNCKLSENFWLGSLIQMQRPCVNIKPPSTCLFQNLQG